jgi:hypothetical protein
MGVPRGFMSILSKKSKIRSMLKKENVNPGPVAINYFQVENEFYLNQMVKQRSYHLQKDRGNGPVQIQAQLEFE